MAAYSFLLLSRRPVNVVLTLISFLNLSSLLSFLNSIMRSSGCLKAQYFQQIRQNSPLTAHY